MVVKYFMMLEVYGSFPVHINPHLNTWLAGLNTSNRIEVPGCNSYTVWFPPSSLVAEDMFSRIVGYSLLLWFSWKLFIWKWKRWKITDYRKGERIIAIDLGRVTILGLMGIIFLGNLKFIKVWFSLLFI